MDHDIHCRKSVSNSRVTLQEKRRIYLLFFQWVVFSFFFSVAYIRLLQTSFSCSLYKLPSPSCCSLSKNFVSTETKKRSPSYRRRNPNSIKNSIAPVRSWLIPLVSLRAPLEWAFFRIAAPSPPRPAPPRPAPTDSQSELGRQPTLAATGIWNVRCIWCRGGSRNTLRGKGGAYDKLPTSRSFAYAPWACADDQISNPLDTCQAFTP